MTWPSGNVHATVHPVVGLVPEFVTVTAPWNPPCHEPVTAYVAVHAVAPVPVGVGLGLPVRVGEADGVGDPVRVGEADGVGEARPVPLTMYIAAPWLGTEAL